MSDLEGGGKLKAQSTLRQKAEEIISARSPRILKPLSETDLLRLVHELEVNQLELELQNNELLMEKERAATASERFVELYDFAPTGYFTLSSNGEILELNLTAAKMLGKSRSELKNRLFGFLVAIETRPIFNSFLDNVFNSDTKNTCELVLSIETHRLIDVRMDGIVSQNGEGCLITMVDITEQKQNEARTKKSEIFLKSAQMIAGLGTFSIDLIRRNWESSEVLDLIFGISPDFEKSISSWVSIVHPDWQQKMKDYFHSAIADHDPVFETEYQILRQSDHSVRWIHVTGQIEFDSQNQPLVLLGALADITSRKLIEEKLKVSEKSYHSLISNLHVGVLLQGPHSEILLSNYRALELLGLTEDQLLGKTSFDEDWNVIHEDGTSYPGPTHPVPQSIATCQSVRNAVMGVYRPTTRDRVWLLVNADPQFDQEGTVKEVICTFEDITELKNTDEALLESEHFYRSLFENMNGFAYCRMLFDDGKPLDFIYLMVNKSFEAQTGFSNVIGKKVTEVIPGIREADPDLFEIYGRVAKTGVSERFEMFIEAMQIWVAVSVYSPKPDHFVSVFDVITERKVLEQQVISSERQYRDIFHKNTAVKFVIDPASGNILTANQAAATFYGYSVSQLETMNINEINILPPEQVQAEMSLAFSERRNYFNFRHRLASGEIRDVEVYSGPINSGERTLLYSIVHDISKRKLAEDALRIANWRMESIIQGTNVGTWEWNIQTGETVFNEEWTKIIGYSLEDLDPTTITTWEAYAHPEDLKLSEEMLQKHFAGITSYYDCECRMKHKDGHWVWVHDRGCVTTWTDDGKPLMMFGTHTDITERKLAEDALRQSEERFRTVVECSSNSIVVHQDGKIVFVNPAAIKMFGATSTTDLLGLPILDRIHPDYHEIILNRVRKAIIEGSIAPIIEAKYIRLDGAIIDAEVQGAVIVFDGKPAIQASIYDITERKLIEERLKLLSTRLLLATRAGGVGVWDYDIVNDNLIWDDQMYALYGVDKTNFVVNYQAWLKMIHPDDVYAGNMEVQKAITGEKEFNTELRVLWPDGTIHNIRILAVVQRDNAGKPLNMIGTNWDISAQKLAEVKLNEKNLELQHVNAEKDKFFSIIAHDLRSPFNGFLGLTQMLDEDLSEMTSNEIQESARMMRKSATNLFNLLGNLLEWSRMQRGFKAFEPVSCFLLPIISECISLVKETAIQKNIEINCNVRDHLVVYADENMLNGVFRNILSNAVKFTRRGGKITISANVISDNSVECSIRDTGIGMSKQVIDNVFKLDVNTNRNGTEGELSTGLGLILCKDFIEKHGGKLWVESEESVGSTFRFILPDKKV